MTNKQAVINPMLLTAAAAAGMAAYGLLVFLPVQRRINELRTRRIQDERTIVENEMLARDIRLSQEHLDAANEIAQQWQRQSQALRGPQLFDALTSSASQHQLEIIELSPGARQSHQSLHEVPIRFKALGSMQSLQAFFHEVEQLPIKVWCVDLAITPSASNTDHPDILEHQFELVVFEARGDFSDQVDLAASR